MRKLLDKALPDVIDAGVDFSSYMYMVASRIALMSLPAVGPWSHLARDLAEILNPISRASIR